MGHPFSRCPKAYRGFSSGDGVNGSRQPEVHQQLVEELPRCNQILLLGLKNLGKPQNPKERLAGGGKCRESCVKVAQCRLRQGKPRSRLLGGPGPVLEVLPLQSLWWDPPGSPGVSKKGPSRDAPSVATRKASRPPGPSPVPPDAPSVSGVFPSGDGDGGGETRPPDPGGDMVVERPGGYQQGSAEVTNGCF